MDHVAKRPKSMETVEDAEGGAAMKRVIFELMKQQCLCKPCHAPKTGAEQILANLATYKKK
jgi:hypothetical protein